MPMFKVKSPDKFPGVLVWAFTQAMEEFAADPTRTQIEKEVHFHIDSTVAAAKGKQAQRLIETERVRVGAFKRMVKLHPFYHLHEFLNTHSVRVSAKMFSTGWGLHLTFKSDSGILDSFQAALKK